MKNKALYIGIGVVALLGYFFLIRKKGADATTSEGAETRSAEATDSTGGRGIVPPTKGSALTTSQPATPTCGCGTGQTPCPNVRCASKTQLTPTTSSAPNSAASTASATTRNCAAEAREATKKLPFALRGAAKIAYIEKCKSEGGQGFAFAFTDETYDMLYN